MKDSYIQRLFENADEIEALKNKHNVSISITEACSPDNSLKKEWRAAHLRSNSDITPKCGCPSPAPLRALPPRRPHPRSHSLGARPGQKHAMKQQSLSIPVQRSSLSHLAIEFSPHAEISTLSSILAKCEKNSTPKNSPRRICSERSSPNVSVISIPDSNPLLLKVSPMINTKSSSQLIYVPSDPWTKMADCNYKTGNKLTRVNHLSLDYSSTDNGPWVLHDSAREHPQRKIYRKSRSLSKQRSNFDNKYQEANFQKFHRYSTVSCDTCWASDSCKCPKYTNPPKTSPIVDNNPLEMVLSSPSRFYPDGYGAGKTSPVILKTPSRSSSVNSRTSQNPEPLSSNKLDPACICNNPIQSTSPRPSPQRLSPRISNKSLKENSLDILDKCKKEVDKIIIENCNANESTIITKDITEVLQSEKSLTEKDNRASKSMSVCDPLLETTC